MAMAIYSHRETRLNVDAPSSQDTIDIVLPSRSSFAARGTPKRRRVAQAIHDESTFSKTHLASESSIHFRSLPRHPSFHPTPRAILWRVLEDRTVLELQAVDLFHDPPQKESERLAIRFTFPDPLAPTGIAFAEPDNGKAPQSFAVMALTRRGELFQLSLRRDAFIKPDYFDMANTATAGWCRSSIPSALSLRSPHRLLVTDDKELWVALGDSSLARLQKQPNGSNWQETLFTEGGWKASMRGFMAWKGSSSVRYGNIDLDGKTATSIVCAPDNRHIWAVCLDHALRVWDVSSGQMALEIDLGGDANRDFQQPVSDLVDPGHENLIRLITSKGAQDYTVVTFSPHLRQFKFWSVKDSKSGLFHVEPAYPEFVYRPPIDDLVQSPVWTLNCFHIQVQPVGKTKTMQMWISVQTGSHCHTFTIAFDPNAKSSALSSAWTHNWFEVGSGQDATDNLSSIPAGKTLAGSSEHCPTRTSVVESWTDFILDAGRFTTATLETALLVYKRSLSRRDPNMRALTNSNLSLKERVCECVGAAARLRQSPGQGPAYDQYESDVASQWNVFYGVLLNLHKQRERTLSLAYDPQENIPWLIMADQISPIRRQSTSETLWRNQEVFSLAKRAHPYHQLRSLLENDTDEQVGKLFHVLAVFRDLLPADFLRAFRHFLFTDSLQAPTGEVSERVQSLYDHSGFNGRVSDEDFDTITQPINSLLGGYLKIDNKLLHAAARILGEELQGKPQKKSLNLYGKRFLSQGSRESYESGLDMLTSMQLLVVFMAVELEDEELSEDLDPFHIYESLSQQFRAYSLLRWLANTVPRGSPSSDLHDNILMQLLADDWETMQTPPKLQMDELLTYYVRSWTLNTSLLQNYDSIATNVMSNLLTKGEIDRALDFLKFLPNTAWATYIRGRLYLARRELSEAAACFEEAAPELVSNFDVKSCDSGGLLTVDERNYFDDDYDRYYQHVVNLLDKAGAMSYVAHFASLALGAIEKDSDPNEAQRTDLLSRLFTAQLRTSRYAEAFDALTKYTDLALRKYALQSLLNTLISTSHISFLLSLPYTEDLAQEADAHLENLLLNPAKSPFAVTSQPKTSFDPTQEVSVPVSATSTTPPTPYKTLYAFRIRHKNPRGAAVCLYERLQRLRFERDAGIRGEDVDEEVGQVYLALINCLNLVEASLRWMLVRPIEGVPPHVAATGSHVVREKRGKRKAVTLEDVRREWQGELDRVSDLEAGRFEVGIGMDLDLDVDEDGDDREGEVGVRIVDEASGRVGREIGVSDG